MSASGHRDSPETAAESGWSILAKWLLGLALVILVPLFVVAVVAGIFLWGYVRGQNAAAAAAEEEVARLQAAGQPMTAKELYAYQRVPSGVLDTTDAWRDAMASFDPRFAGDGKSLPFVGDGDRDLLRPGARGEDLSAAQEFLKKYDGALAAILAAAKQPGQCRLPLKFEDGVSAKADSTQRMRTLVRLLALNFRVRACQGDTAGALESLIAMIAASDATAHQLTNVEQLVRMVTLGMALSEAEFLLNEVQLMDQQLARLAERIAASDVKASFAEGLVGERALGQITIGQMPQVPFAADRLGQLELMKEAIAASREPFPAGRRHFQQIAETLQAEQAAAGPFDKQKHVLTMQLIPSLTASFDACARTLAYQQAVLAAIAAQRYRLRHGRFPAQLDDLCPDFLTAVPKDPFDGQPLRMLTRDGALIIYSVGKDERDDHAANPPGKSFEPDIVVRLK